MGVEDNSIDINLAIQALAKFARYTNSCANKVPYVIVDRKPFQITKKELPNAEAKSAIKKEPPTIKVESANVCESESQHFKENIPEGECNGQNTGSQCDKQPEDNLLQDKVRKVLKVFVANSQIENRCRFCDKVFKYAGHLTRHENDKHLQSRSKNKKPRLSETSTKKIEKKSKRTLKSILNGEPTKSQPDMKCRFCEKLYKQRARLIKHENNKHLHPVKPLKNRSEKDLIFSCDFCPKTSSNRRQIVKHVWNVHRSRSHICEICKMKFKHRSQLEVHLNTHTKLKNFQCDECKQGFATKTAMQYHIQLKVCTENDELKNKSGRKLTCHICKKKISSMGNLRQHLKLCDPKYKKKVKCPMCKKSFQTKAYLRKHLVHSHTSDRECFCHHCNRKFSRKDNLKFHLYSRCLHKWNKP